ncbi:hypothetical protein AV530_019232 [Patagioenas fasciata monilis]|uniref:Uncharacterized protein n=1 Tax=Patagioenas fasciata monilis TaxID=372326 RepID=A0A1V4K4J1_PATFA|nr:hypothetical protein AV530_019232 [Patagioenas fasciata monilis]
MQVRSRAGCWFLRGPLVPDGYGVGVGHVLPPSGSAPFGHAPLGGPAPPGGLLVTVTSFACCPHTDPEKFGGELGGVLDTLRGLLGGH